MNALVVVSIPVSDQQRAKRFYQEIGFQLLVENEICEGQTWIQLGFPGQVTTISLVSTWPFKQMPAGSLQGVFLETKDIDKERKKLVKKGIEVSGINDSPWGKFASFSDPDGNGLTLHERRD